MSIGRKFFRHGRDRSGITKAGLRTHPVSARNSAAQIVLDMGANDVVERPLHGETERQGNPDFPELQDIAIENGVIADIKSK